VSNTNGHIAGVVCTGFPSYRDFADDSLSAFIGKLQSWKKVRLFGSAALSLAYVASGRCDGYVEEDIRSGTLRPVIAIVKAAGGCAEMRPKDKMNLVHAAATNCKIPLSKLL